MREPDILLYYFTKLKAIHFRHHHIAHNEVGHVGSDFINALKWIIFFDHMKLIAKNGLYIIAHINIVINNKNGSFKLLNGISLTINYIAINSFFDVKDDVVMTCFEF